jgi:hypothetical protein
MKRREFAKIAACAAAALPVAAQAGGPRTIDDFRRPDSFYAGHGWHSLNPGYWEIKNSGLRRRLRTRGDRARKTGFPFHAYLETDYEALPPYGMIWRRDWKLERNYAITAELTVHESPRKRPEPGYSLGGVAFGARSLYESWDFKARRGDAAWFAAWRDDGRFGVYDHATGAPVSRAAESQGPAPQSGDQATIEVVVSGASGSMATIDARLTVNGTEAATIHLRNFDRSEYTNGFFGLVARGWLDFQVDRVTLDPQANQPIPAPVNELRVAYPLGDSLKQVDGRWTCRFLAVFRQEGRRAEIRISDQENPDGGWSHVPAAGAAAIVTNDFRRATSVVDVVLPFNPAQKELYYTVWKDGEDVTADPRPGAQRYIGRLPRLTPPYKLCGLSCHAIHGPKPGMERTAAYQENWIHPQPLRDAYLYLEHFDFQVMLWEDDIWYLELLLYPASTDDAYQIIMTTIANETTRWQMMRHWNVLNPGDHDHGMDDVKGPEQLAVRNRADLGQDPEYMRRNFQIVEHLIRGADSPSGTENPKRWRRWKMPDNDFSLLILDARLWRSSQETHLWVTEGWGDAGDIYRRDDPTRSLLGEEQFAWLQQTLATDSSPLICLTGLNGLHTIWQPSSVAEPRNRIAADYAGWAKAGADRVIELLSRREGVVTVYGDVHVGSIVRNRDHRLYECSFGPIGRTGGRAVKDGFGPLMEDYDGRPLEAIALYHQSFESPNLKPQSSPGYWNFLEIELDPRGADPRIGLQLRRLDDVPNTKPRGGGAVRVRASETGRTHDSKLPPIRTLPNADVRFTLPDGEPLRGARSLADGSVPVTGLVGVPRGQTVIITVFDNKRVQSHSVVTT